MPRLDTPTPEPESSSSSSSSSDGEFDEESLHDTNSHAYVPATTDAHQGYVPLTNETKRKAEYAESYGQLAKIPRQESPFSAEAWLAATANQEAGEVRDDDDDYDDGGGDGDGDGDDVDSDDDADDNTNGNVGEDLAINMAPHVQPITHNKPLQLHPSFPRTAWQLFTETFPTLHVPNTGRRGYLYRTLAGQPVRRVPAVKKTFHLGKPQNLQSFLLQATGTLLPREKACDKCRIGRSMYGSACVVSMDPDIKTYTSGTCASCWYNRAACLCSLREVNPNRQRRPNGFTGTSSIVEGGTQSALVSHQSAVSVSSAPPMNGGMPPPTAPSLPKPQRPQWSQMLQQAPSYRNLPTATEAAYPSTALAAVAFTPAGTPPVMPPATKTTTTTTTTTTFSALDSKIKAWEDGYSLLGRQELIDAHKSLMEWQDDLAIRSMAMNRVLSKLYTSQ